MDLKKSIQRIKVSFDHKEKEIRKLLPLTDEIVNKSAKAICLMHEQDFIEAKKLFESIIKLFSESAMIFLEYPDLYYSGYMYVAQKEFVEAMVFFAILADSEIATPEELKVEHTAYIHGLAESVGEIDRHMSDCIRKGNLESAQRMFDWMKKIYLFLMEFNHRKAVSRDLKHARDMVRKLLGRATGKLTEAVVREQDRKDRERYLKKMEQLFNKK